MNHPGGADAVGTAVPVAAVIPNAACPVTCNNGKYTIAHNGISRERMVATDKELREECAGVEHLIEPRALLRAACWSALSGV